MSQEASHVMGFCGIWPHLLYTCLPIIFPHKHPEIKVKVGDRYYLSTKIKKIWNFAEKGINPRMGAKSAMYAKSVSIIKLKVTNWQSNLKSFTSL